MSAFADRAWPWIHEFATTDRPSKLVDGKAKPCHDGGEWAMRELARRRRASRRVERQRADDAAVAEADLGLDPAAVQFDQRAHQRDAEAAGDVAAGAGGAADLGGSGAAFVRRWPRRRGRC